MSNSVKGVRESKRVLLKYIGLEGRTTQQILSEFNDRQDIWFGLGERGTKDVVDVLTQQEKLGRIEYIDEKDMYRVCHF